MTESTSAVEQAVQQRIAAARAKVQAARQRRDDLAEARKAGLAHRHAAKLRHLAEAEERRQTAEPPPDDDQDDGQLSHDKENEMVHGVQAHGASAWGRA